MVPAGSKGAPPGDGHAAAPTPTAATFTLRGAVIGARIGLPIALAGDAYGLVYGSLARQAGLGLAESVLASGVVYAGAAQLIALDLWTTPLPVATIVLTTFVVNARHLLMGASLQPWLAPLPAPRRWAALALLSDESWAIAERERAAGRTDAAVLVGCGGVLYLSWVGTTAAGHLLGAALPSPQASGLDFAFVALFAALLAGAWDGPRRLPAWLVAGAVAVVAARWLPGGWYVPLGAVAGSLIGLIGGDDER